MNQNHLVRSLGLAAASLALLSLTACDNGSGGGGGSPTTGPSTSAGNPSSSSGGGSPTTASGNPSSSAGTPTSSSTSGSTGGTFVNAGYVTAGTWSGYGYTVADTLGEGTTVSPTCAGMTCTPPFTGNSFCMTGSVAKDAAYNGFALLGWNLSQDATTSVIKAWPVPASGGVTITVANPDAAPMRLQVEIPNAATASDRYCATLTSGVEIKWSDLETSCYASTGNTKLAAGTMLQNAAVQVYGTNTTAVPFNICITGMTLE